jgi:hypothetical protein
VQPVDRRGHWSTVVKATAALLLVIGLSGASCAQPADGTPKQPASHQLCTRMILHGGFVVVPCKPTVIDLIAATTSARP